MEESKESAILVKSVKENWCLYDIQSEVNESS